MTGEQLALTVGDCEPTFDATDALVLLHNHIDHRDWDLRHQGLTAWQIHTMQTVKVKEQYL